MVFKNLYTDAQWRDLQVAFGHVFLAVADADGVIDKKEEQAMQKILQSAGKLGMPFTDEILTTINESGLDVLQMAKDEANRTDDILRSVGVSSKVAGNNEANDYKKVLISAGIFIGSASGKFLRKNICEEEYDKVERIGNLIGFNANIVFDAGIADKIIANFVL